MIEVEVKAKINSFKEMHERLEKIGAVKSRKEYQKDTYFNSPVVDFAKTDEALRIRKTDSATFITYKGPKIDKKSKTRREIETGISDGEKVGKIFEAVGFSKVRGVEKSRQYYSYEDFEISLDDVNGLEPYMEIEIGLDDGEDYSEAQERIFELFKKLGIESGFETTSYLELLENL